MRVCGCWRVLTSIAIVAVALAARGAEPTSAPSQAFSVAETYNQKPFDYQMKLSAERHGYRVYRVTYASPIVTEVEPNNTISADLYLPDNIKPGDPKRPAVINLHVLNGNMQATDLACSMLAMRGIPAVMFTLPYYNERAKPEGWEVLLREPKLFMSMVCQSIEDVRRTVDLLASRPEIDPKRIGVAGISLGSILAASSASVDPRIYRASLFLSGSDLLQIVHHARYTRELSSRFRNLPTEERLAIEAQVDALDPLKLAPLLRERAQKGQVQMINAADDEIIPREGTEKLAAALGISDRVVWIDNLEHNTFVSALPQVLRQTTDFFAQDLPAGVSASSTPVIDERTPLGRATTLVRQGLAMLSTEPDPGRCHRMEIEVPGNAEAKNPLETRVRYVRGTADKFTLKCRIPMIGDITMGQGEFPWMITGGKGLLKGVKNPVEDRNPLCFADARHVARLRIFGGVLGSLALVPDAICHWATLEDEKAADGCAALRITPTQRIQGTLLVSFGDDGQTPKEAEFDVAGTAGKAVVHRWQVNAVAEDAVFNPPSDLPAVEVDQADLYRAFATMFDLAMQRVD